MPKPDHSSPFKCPDAAAISLSSGMKAICSRDFMLITLINFLVMSTYYMLFVTGTSYARDAYGLSLSAAGFSTGMMVIGCLSGRFVSGNVISAIGLKPMLLAGLVSYAICLLGFYHIHSLWLLCLQRFLTGVGIGIALTATGTFIACIVPHVHHGLGISVFSISTVLALAFGPFMGIILSGTIGYGMLVGLSLAVDLICAGLTFSVTGVEGLYRKKRPVFSLQSYIDPRIVRFSIVAFIIAMGYGCVQVFLPSFAAMRGLKASSSLFFICYALAALLTRPISGRLFDRFGEKRLLPPLFIITMLAFALLAMTHGPLLLLASGLLLGIGFGNYQSIGQAVAISRVTRSRFAQATTTFFIFFDLGIGIGPYLFGMLIPLAGYSGLFAGLVASSLMALLLYWFITD